MQNTWDPQLVILLQRVGELQVELSKLGFKPDKINQMTEATSNLATATDSELAESAPVTGGILSSNMIQ